jgi:hypothetical protein
VNDLLTPASADVDPMAADMLRVDDVIRLRLASDVALINQISHYIINAGGKRIRPRLVLLVAQALGFMGPERHELAATVEFIHTATLLHDDVVDESSLRRGRADGQRPVRQRRQRAGGRFSVLARLPDDGLVNRMRVLEVLADATNVIAEGEVLQLMNMHDPDLAVDDYLRSSATRRPSCSRPAPAWVRCWPMPRATWKSLRRLRPRAGHGLPAGGRPARLRRRHPRAGQERRRRPARGQAHAAAAGGHGAAAPMPSAS